jgi:probable rRNA maturation factor
MSKISITAMKKGSAASPDEKALIKQCIRYALEAEDIDVACLVAVHTTDNEGIKKLNREQRSIDRETDVLSFPMLSLLPGEKPQPSPSNMDPETGLVFLGDIVISLEKAKQQAEEYGHSVERELGFLTVHSLLHLLGYDHEGGEQQAAEMRNREEIILEKLGLTRIS